MNSDNFDPTLTEPTRWQYHAFTQVVYPKSTTPDSWRQRDSLTRPPVKLNAFSWLLIFTAAWGLLALAKMLGWF